MDKSVNNKTTPLIGDKRHIVRIATPSPLPQELDYLYSPTQKPMVGARVSISLGARHATGFVTAFAESSQLSANRLKHIGKIIDPQPLLPDDVWKLCRWAANYYQHAFGLVLQKAIPVPLRRGNVANLPHIKVWRAAIEPSSVEQSLSKLSKAPKQKQLLTQLLENGPMSIAELGGSSAPLRALEQAGYISSTERPADGPPFGSGTEQSPLLNNDQQTAVAAITAASSTFQPFLLQGITGSGKTEVYLNAIEHVLEKGQRALLLLPEINLTPQFIERFKARLKARVLVLHSGLAEGERLRGWLQARNGMADVLIGTRSAVFTPLPNLGLVIVDEEHEPAFKQQDGLRYSARDLAIVRANTLNIPAVLGSATPSLESLLNCENGRYKRLRLPARAGKAIEPIWRCADLRGQTLTGGLCNTALIAIEKHLANEGQVLIFLNRRGFAPVLMCHDCGWTADCQHCDARYTLHRADRKLRCHHCGDQRMAATRCPDCNGGDLNPYGQGTEQLEQVLVERFPETSLLRIDGDTTRRKGSLNEKLNAVHSGEARLLIGTQMLAKGHDFPALTLVVVVDADQGLLTADFRGTERFSQLTTQVAGRAGRAEKPGEVLIQTHRPDHPLLQTLLRDGYEAAAEIILKERKNAHWPPYSAVALIRADASQLLSAMTFLDEASNPLKAAGLLLAGPNPAPMQKRGGRHRAQLLLQANDRHALQRAIATVLPTLHRLPSQKNVKWTIDVDPADLF